MIPLENKLEAVLFYRGEPESSKRLIAFLGVSEEELEGAVERLTAQLAGRGVRLLAVGDQLELVTAPETSDVIAALRRNELTRELGRAGAETLAIILYRGPATRAQIDHIRGVNSAFILRNLMIRGLIERVHGSTGRSFSYQATPALLKHLGVARIEDLPEYSDVQQQLESFEERLQNDADSNTPQPNK